MRDRLLIPMSLAAMTSVLLHLGGLVPLLVRLTAAADARSVRASFDPQDFRKPPDEAPPPEPEPALGLDAPSPTRFTWVGYAEYQEHLAALAEVEQAAFTDSPLAAGSPRESSAPMPADAAPPAEPEAAADSPQAADVVAAIESQLGELRQFIGELRIALAQARSTTMPPRPSQATEPRPAQPSASQPQEQSIAADDQGTRTDPGDAADKQSDPSSIIEVTRDQWRLGKPLAAQGLELRPQRPEFTVLTMLTAAPANPLCRIVFGRDGVPVEAAIVQTSGDARVDEAILASLYRWRASGAPLQASDPDSRFEVRIMILLTRRRAG